MSHKSVPGPGQEVLFGLESIPDAPAPGQPTELPAEDWVASTNVLQRAHEIGEALKALNAANRRAGLQAAAAGSYRDGLERHYGADLNKVVAGARAHEDDDLLQAKIHFSRAVGMNSLLAAGLPKNAVKTATAQMFDAFTARYGVGVTNAAVRNKEAKRIQRSADIITGHGSHTRKQAS